MITKKAFRKITGILVPSIVIALYLCPIPVMANDHKRNEIHADQYKSGKGSLDSNDRKNRRLKSKDEGNELTGLATAWLLGAANFTVLLSLLLKGANRHLPLKPETKNAVGRFNQFQKKHLMRFLLSVKSVGPVHRVPAFSFVLLPKNSPARMGAAIFDSDGFTGIDGEI